MAPLISTWPSFPLSQSLASGSFHKPLNLLHQRADRLKTTITENECIWSQGQQLCLTQWNYEPCLGGSSKTDRSWWRVLTKHVPLEKGMANYFSILALRTPWTVWKSKKKKKNRTLKDELLRWVGVQYATGDGWRITPERMKRWVQSKNNTQLRMWLVMEVKSDAVKSNIA